MRSSDGTLRWLGIGMTRTKLEKKAKMIYDGLSDRQRESFDFARKGNEKSFLKMISAIDDIHYARAIADYMIRLDAAFSAERYSEMINGDAD